MALAVAGYVHRHRGGAAGIVSVRTAGAQHPVYFYVEALGAGVDGGNGYIHRYLIIGVAGAILNGGNGELALWCGIAIGRQNIGSNFTGRHIHILNFHFVQLPVTGNGSCNGLLPGALVGVGAAGLHHSVNQDIVSA